MASNTNVWLVYFAPLMHLVGRDEAAVIPLSTAYIMRYIITWLQRLWGPLFLFPDFFRKLFVVMSGGLGGESTEICERRTNIGISTFWVMQKGPVGRKE